MMIILPTIDPKHYAEFANLCSELPETYAGWLGKVRAWKRHYREPEYEVRWVAILPAAFKEFLAEGPKQNSINSMLAFTEAVHRNGSLYPTAPSP